MSEKKIAARIELSGEKEFKSAVTSCNKSLSTMKSEMNLVKQQTAGSANTLDSLKKKHEVLTRTLEASIKKEEAVRKGLDNSRKDYDKVGSELQGYKDQLKAAGDALKKMKDSGTATEEELKSQATVVANLEAVVKSGEGTYQRAGDRVQDWQKQLNNAQAKVLEATNAVRDNAKYMEEAENSTNGCASSIDKYGKKLSNTAQSIKNVSENVNKLDLGNVVKAYEIIGDTFQNITASAYNATLELDEGYDTIITKTGATGDALDELNEVADNIFGELPTDMATVGIAVGEVNTRFSQTGDILEETSKQFIEFAEINGTDLNSSIDTVDRIIKQFGLDASDAGNILGIMTKRGQETGISVTGLMNAIDGNSATLKELNLGVEESVNLMAMFESNGVDASTALRSLKTAVNNYAKEGLTAREGLDKTIESIKNATTNTEALAIAQETFGTKGAQVMVDGIRTGRINIDTLSDSLSNYGTTVSDTYNATLDPWDKMTVATNNLKTAGAQLTGEFFSAAEPAVNGFTGVIKDLSKGFSKLPGFIKTPMAMIGGLGTVAGKVIPQMANFKKSLDILGVTQKVTKLLGKFNKVQEATAAATELATTATGLNTVAHEAGAAVVAGSATASTADATAKGAEAIATEGATVAQSGLNIAMEACPVLMIVGAVGALIGVLAAFASGAEDTTSAVGVLRSEADACIDSLSESQEQLNNTMESANEVVAKSEGTGVIADDVAEKLLNLADKTSLTSDEQKEMSMYVAELNQLYPDLGLEIDSVTGKLNKSNAEITALIDNVKNISLARAYNEAFSDSIDGVVEAQKTLITSKAKLKDIDVELNDISKQRNKVTDLMTKSLKKNGDGIIEWNGVMRDGTDVLMELSDQESALTDKQKELNQTIEDQQPVIDAASETAQSYYEAYQELNDQVIQNTEAMQENTDAQNAGTEAQQLSINTAGEAATVFNSLSTEQQDAAVRVANSITELSNSIQGTLESQMNMFEEFNAGTEITKDQILSNMQSQVDGVTAWEENMNTLMTETKTATDGTQVQISEGLMQYLASMGPQGATYMQEFVNMSGDELKQANALWEQSVDMKTMTNNLGLQLQDGIGAMSAGSQAAFQDLASTMGVQASEVGGFLGQGFVEGMSLAASEIQEAGTEMGENAITSLKTSTGVASPSKKTKEIGGFLDDGLRDGIRGKMSTVTGQVQTLASLTISTFGQTLYAARTQRYGYEVARGLAQGIANGSSLAINAAARLASDTIATAKSKLEINSPSHVFQRIGSGVIEGFVKGVDDNEAAASRTIRDAMDFSNIEAKTSLVNNGYNTMVENFSAAMNRQNNATNAELIRKLDAVYSVLSTYLPNAGTMYIDGNKVTKQLASRFAGYQSKEAKLKAMVTGAR